MDIFIKKYLTEVVKNDFPANPLGNEHAGGFSQSIIPIYKKDEGIVEFWIKFFAKMFDVKDRVLYTFETAKYVEITDFNDSDKMMDVMYGLYIEALPEFEAEYSKITSKMKFGKSPAVLDSHKFKEHIIQTSRTIYKNK